MAAPMTITPDDLSLYHAYRGMTDKAYANSGNILFSLYMFRDKRFYDPAGTDTFVVDKQQGKHKVYWGIPGYEDLLLPLYLEGVALAHVFGNFAAEDKMAIRLAEQLRQQGIPIDEPPAQPWEYWRQHKSQAEAQFDDTSGKMYVYAALEVIRAQSALHLLHDAGLITHDQFRGGLASIEQQMDRVGLNGAERMVAARPELLDRFAQDKRKILVGDKQLQDMPSFPKGQRPDYATLLLQNYRQYMPRGEYYTIMRDHVCTTPDKQHNLLMTMMGDEYAQAYRQRIDTLKPHEVAAKSKGELNVSLSELTARIEVPVSAETALRTFFINYGLGSTHERLGELRSRFESHARGSGVQAPQLTSGASGTSWGERVERSGDDVGSGMSRGGTPNERAARRLPFIKSDDE